jgi:hypothetical protein
LETPPEFTLILFNANCFGVSINLTMLIGRHSANTFLKNPEKR